MHTTRSGRRRWGAVVAASAALALTLTACGGGGTDDETGGGDGDEGASAQEPLTVYASTLPSFQSNFNPFSPSALTGAKGLIYEPLMAYTGFRPGEGTPFLATDMTFNDDGTVLTITLREGVQWSDGEDLTVDDVVFTFEAMRDEPAINGSALPIEAAAAGEGNTVEVTFSEPAFSLIPSIGNSVIVPEHVYGEQEIIAEYVDEDPVGSGPYDLMRFSQQLYQLEKNDTYWNADEVGPEQIDYPAMSNQTFTAQLGEGGIDWAGGFLANVDQAFIDKDPENNHYWFPGAGMVHLVLNNQNPIFDDIELRRAMLLAIDRQQLSDTAMAGHAQPATTTGLVLPAQQDFAEDNTQPLELNVDEANSILDAAGYTAGDDGIRTTPAGERLAFTLSVPSDFADWISIVTLLQEQFAAVGIEMTPQGVATQEWSDGLRAGSFEVAMANAGILTSPYFFYRAFMSSALSAPAGEQAITNYSRWEDPETDQLLADFAATNDPEAQRAAVVGLGEIMETELPVIPMLQSPTWGLNRTANFSGFPNDDDPYANPTPYTYPDNLLVVMNLDPVE
ncbi:extracellular solute-binding protein family 5 [Beutenbergia cavernae DSM 12333]|uniref:Extracellular solute-binding protein family 5 n=1 Tax=Beutenbergia cavernae (strain ATCC BAA-8 / DSM 12333 / CCUG 43141 / JCM 11478 / NBRC 16432 / NCIMB 13614 / HKI 0122) TaxID=471853 RepID=C5C2H1_BEUC1|nr:ABC transporter substrate-binding protein [Beutenbergia cavernae]ACQ79657.1 extracellular solute-binding protein family 5 [Beutenbergia cavernae DSM 12333]